MTMVFNKMFQKILKKYDKFGSTEKFINKQLDKKEEEEPIDSEEETD